MHNKTVTINLSVSGTASPVAHIATLKQQQTLVCLSRRRTGEERREGKVMNGFMTLRNEGS